MSINRDGQEASSEAEVFVSALRDLHLRAGKPSTRSMSKATGTVSHTTVAELLGGRRIPSWPVVASIVRHLGGNEMEFHQLWLAAIGESPDSMADTQASRDFLELYRQQVIRYHGRLRIPDFNRRHSAAIEALYVPQRIIRQSTGDSVSSVRELDISQFDKEIKRAVVLGHPGGGKSVLCQMLMYQHAVERDDRIPFLVVLRDFAAQVPPDRSVVGYIEHQMETVFQLRPPQGLVSSLLLNGSALVMFDGLDELLDPARRAEIASIIELFSTEFSLTPILVTSRIVGYDQARLDPTLFSTYGLANFNNAQVLKYVRAWFGTEHDRTVKEANRLARSFMSESAFVSDLRAVPLMLALLCTIYRGQGYIPRNRPELYEKCAELMFERWDSSRGIQPRQELRFWAHVRPVLQYLAFWMLTQRSQASVSSSELVRAITEYLTERRFEDADEAEDAARRFLDFSLGRAWVFTDVGTTEQGELLYGFTHRTFMEYFAAVHLARTFVTPRDVARELLPHVAQAEWNAVGQIAIQIVDRNVEDGAERVITALLDESYDLPLEERSNVRNFVAQSLEFAHLSPSLKHRLTASQN
jgi:predicted NACHT family NTPase